MINGIDFKKIVPSEIVRNNMDFDKIGDVGIATLIENKIYKRYEKMEMFECILKQTDNETLKKEISDYISDEKYKYNALTNNDGSFVYVLHLYHNDEDIIYGCFNSFEDAYRYAVHSKNKCSIEKRPILGMGNHKVYDSADLGEKPLYDGDHDRDGEEVVLADIDEDGLIAYIYLEDCPCVTHDFSESLLYSYVEIYNPFDKGDIVTKAEDKSFIGVVSISQETWKEEMERIKRHDQVYNSDFGDEVLLVHEISEEGYVSHHHICPTELEFADLKNYDSAQAQFVEAVSSVEKGRPDLQWMMMCYDSLAYLRKE